MKAIVTKYHGPTETRGARIVATDQDGNRKMIPQPLDTQTDEEAHMQAAVALCRKMRWEGELVAGAIKDGYVFVWGDGGRYFV